MMLSMASSSRQAWRCRCPTMLAGNGVQLVAAVVFLVLVSIQAATAVRPTRTCRRYSAPAAEQYVNATAAELQLWHCYRQNPCGGVGQGYSSWRYSTDCSSSSNSSGDSNGSYATTQVPDNLGCEVLPPQYSSCSQWTTNTTAESVPCPALRCCSDGSQAAKQVLDACVSVSNATHTYSCATYAPSKMKCVAASRAGNASAAAAAGNASAAAAAGNASAAAAAGNASTPAASRAAGVISVRPSPVRTMNATTVAAAAAAAAAASPARVLPAAGAPFSSRLVSSSSSVPLLLPMTRADTSPAPSSNTAYLGTLIHLTLRFNMPFSKVSANISQFATDLEAELMEQTRLPGTHVNMTTVKEGATNVIVTFDAFYDEALQRTYPEAVTFALNAYVSPVLLTRYPFNVKYAAVSSCFCELRPRFEGDNQPSPSNGSSSSSSTGNNGGLIAGVVVVTLLLAATLGGIGYLELRRHRHKQARKSSGRRYSAGKGVAGAFSAEPKSSKEGWRAWLEAADNVAESVIFFPVDAWRRRKLRREAALRAADELCHSTPQAKMPQIVNLRGSLSGVREVGSRRHQSSGGGVSSSRQHRSRQKSSSRNRHGSGSGSGDESGSGGGVHSSSRHKHSSRAHKEVTKQHPHRQQQQVEAKELWSDHGADGQIAAEFEQQYEQHGRQYPNRHGRHQQQQQEEAGGAQGYIGAAYNAAYTSTMLAGSTRQRASLSPEALAAGDELQSENWWEGGMGHAADGGCDEPVLYAEGDDQVHGSGDDFGEGWGQQHEQGAPIDEWVEGDGAEELLYTDEYGSSPHQQEQQQQGYAEQADREYLDDGTEQQSYVEQGDEQGAGDYEGLAEVQWQQQELDGEQGDYGGIQQGEEVSDVDQHQQQQQHEQYGLSQQPIQQQGGEGEYAGAYDEHDPQQSLPDELGQEEYGGVQQQCFDQHGAVGYGDWQHQQQQQGQGEEGAKQQQPWDNDEREAACDEDQQLHYYPEQGYGEYGEGGAPVDEGAIGGDGLQQQQQWRQRLCSDCSPQEQQEAYE